MSQLYIVQNQKLVGFGISEDYKSRNQKYCSHNGYAVIFPRVYSGLSGHVGSTESLIKKKYASDLVKVRSKTKAEWFDEHIDLTTAIKMIDDLISEHNFKLKIIDLDYTNWDIVNTQQTQDKDNEDNGNRLFDHAG